MQKELLKIIENFNKVRITVVGDIMLDRYIKGRVRRISPEAPVPVIEVNEEKSLPGGAANVAANITALGSACSLVSVIGKDNSGIELERMIKAYGVNCSGLIETDNFRTIEKIRIMAEHQQVARVDREEKLRIEKKLLSEIENRLILSLKEGTDAVIFSDYGKGIFTPITIKRLISACKKRKIPVFVDPKVEHFQLYKEATCITPNTMEAFGGMRETVKYDQASAQELGKKIVKKLSLGSLIITQSENGMTIFDNSSSKMNITHIPTRAREVFDVTGAGDTVISALATAFASCSDILKSAMIANHAAGIAVGKLGTAAISAEELREDIKLWEKP